MPLFITQPMIQLFAVGFAAISAVFLIKEVLIVAPENLSELAKAKYNYNPYLVKNISRQRADALFSASFLMVSIILQGINLIPAPRIMDFGGLGPSAVLILTVLVIILGISWRWNKKYAHRIEEKILKTITAKN